MKFDQFLLINIHFEVFIGKYRTYKISYTLSSTNNNLRFERIIRKYCLNTKNQIINFSTSQLLYKLTKKITKK